MLFVRLRTFSFSLLSIFLIFKGYCISSNTFSFFLKFFLFKFFYCYSITVVCLFCQIRFLKNMLWLLFFKRFYLPIFREGEGTEKEKHQCVFASHTPPTGDLACNPGMCSDWESNQRPFGLQAGTQSTEPHKPGLIKYLKKKKSYLFTFRERGREEEREGEKH